MLGTDDAVALLLDRQIDIAIVTLPLGNPGLTVEPLYSEDIVLLVPACAPSSTLHVAGPAPSSTRR
jgi:DNA-binding transcriptional LysR family regulator